LPVASLGSYRYLDKSFVQKAWHTISTVSGGEFRGCLCDNGTDWSKQE